MHIIPVESSVRSLNLSMASTHASSSLARPRDVIDASSSAKLSKREEEREGEGGRDY